VTFTPRPERLLLIAADNGSLESDLGQKQPLATRAYATTPAARTDPRVRSSSGKAPRNGDPGRPRPRDRAPCFL